MKINTDSKTCMRYRKAKISQEISKKKEKWEDTFSKY